MSHQRCLLQFLLRSFVVPAGLCAAAVSAVAQNPESIALRVLPSALTAPVVEDKTFQWTSALGDSLRFALFQNGFRLAMQPNTRDRLSGKFFKDYVHSVQNIKGWGDGDPVFINYIAHPIQGASASYIQILNDPKARGVEFGMTKEYWHSRLKALAWNAAYSTQFEIGPISESSLGNVGHTKGKAGYVDFIVTPAGGFLWTMAEDWIDKRFIVPWETNTRNRKKRLLYRIALNPARTIANLMHGKGPWHREGRALTPEPIPTSLP